MKYPRRYARPARWSARTEEAVAASAGMPRASRRQVKYICPPPLDISRYFITGTVAVTEIHLGVFAPSAAAWNHHEMNCGDD
jgi:hypothetical protein